MATKTYEIAFKLAGKLSGDFAKTFKAANDSVKGFTNNVNALNKDAANIGNVIKLRKETALSARAYLQAKQRAEELGRAMGKNGTPTQQMIANYQKAKIATDKARVALERKRTALKNAESAAGTAGAKLKTLISRQNELAAAADRARIAQERQNKINAGVSKNNATLSSAAPYASMGGAAMGAGLMSAFTTGADFEASMSSVGAISRASEADLAKLTSQARELGATTEWSASQAASGMQFLSMAGFKTDDTLKAMPGMLSLASAGSIELGRAADIASNILTGFGMNAGEMGRVGDVLTNTFTTSNTDLEMLGYTMKYAAPIAKSVGVSFEEAAAMAGKLGDAGIQGEMAGTSLRNIMLRLSAPTKAGADALEELGVKTTDASGNMRSMPAILADLDKSTKGMSESMRAEFIKSIFETEGMSGAMILMEQAGKGALDPYVESLKRTGSASEIAQKKNDNLKGDIKQLRSAWEEVSIQLYDSVRPALRDFAQQATVVIQKVGAWAQKNPELTRGLTIAATAIAGITAAALPTFIAIKSMQFAFALIKAPILFVIQTIGKLRNSLLLARVAILLQKTALLVWRGTMIVVTATIKLMRGAMLLLNAAMRANPVGAVITIIMALIAVGVLVYKNWDVIEAKLVELWGKFSETFPVLSSIIKTFYESAIKPVVDGIVKTFGGLMDFVAGVFTGDWERAWQGVKDIFSGIWDTLSSVAKAPLNTIIGMVNTLIGGLNSVGSVSILGKKIGINIPKIPTLAEGGIATKPTLALIGEGRESEAVLPLSKLDSFAGGRGGTGVIVNLSVNVTGSADVYADVKRGVAESTVNLKRELERLMANERRLSYS